MPENNYSIKKNRLSKAFLDHMTLQEERLVSDGGEGHHYVFLPPIDSGAEDSNWGRFRFRAEMPEEMICYVYAIAADDTEVYYDGDYSTLAQVLANPNAPSELKLDYFREGGGLRIVGQRDILLYTLRGRYLFLAIDLLGAGDATLEGLWVSAQEDNFMATFPEIYQERNSFFHRYMSVFSSLYQDFQDEIDRLPKLLDVQTCPPELLPVYASWMGLDLNGGFLEEKVMRNLVANAYLLNRFKGTAEVIRQIFRIMLDKEVILLEHNAMIEMIRRDRGELPPNMDEGGIFDVTILIPQHLTETQRSQLIFILNQFKPIRSALRLIELEKSASMDSNSYLDMNAALPVERDMILDEESQLDRLIVLQ